MKNKIILLLAVVLIVGVVGSLAPPVDKGDQIGKDKTLEHARIALAGVALGNFTGTSQLNGATVKEDPLIIKDIKGRDFYYEYSIEIENHTVGYVKVSANKAMGASINTIEPGASRGYDPNTSIAKAKELALNNSSEKILSAELVAYAGDRIGVLVKQTGNKNTIYDAADFTVIPEGDPKKPIDGKAFSPLDGLNETQKSDRRKMWDQDDKHAAFIGAKAKAKGIDLSKGLSRKNLSDLKGEIPLGGLYRVLSVPLYAQENSVKCAVASAQMIASWYGIYDSQNYISWFMGCGYTTGCYDYQQLKYYKTTYYNGGIGRSNSLADYSPTWNEIKYEIDNNRPVMSAISGHARVARGYQTIDSNCGIWGCSTDYYLYINDPWAPWIGKTYWENWNSIWHYYNIYVK